MGDLTVKLTGASVGGIEPCRMGSKRFQIGADEVGFGGRDGIVRACPRIVKGA